MEGAEQWLLGNVMRTTPTYGLIRPSVPLPVTSTKRNVHYYNRVVTDGVRLVGGDSVSFILGDSSDKGPTAKKVTRVVPLMTPAATPQPKPPRENATNKKPNAPKSVNAPSANSLTSPDLAVDAATTFRGSICSTSEEGNFGYLRPLKKLPPGYPPDKDIHFQLDKARSGGLAIMRGDVMEFTLGTLDKSRPKAFNLRLVDCSRRTLDVIEKFMSKALRVIESAGDENRVQRISELCTIPALWRCIGECTEHTPLTAYMCVELLLSLNKQIQDMRYSVKRPMEALSRTLFLEVRRGGLGKLISYAKGRSRMWQTCCEFLLLFVQHVPQKARVVMALLKNVVTTDEHSMEGFLFSMLQVLAKNTGGDIEDLVWDELPLVPCIQELTRSSLDDLINVTPVREHGPYDSVDEYMDTYFRLLRADCFSALCEGIRSYLRGDLDSRDMNVYRYVGFAGLHFRRSHGGLAIMLQLVPLEHVRDWKKSTKLMFGNLLCISISGTFRDPIWATVAFRDIKMLEKNGVIIAELCSSNNTMSDADAIAMLAQASVNARIAESPNYYKAFEPVMKSLQSANPANLPFQNELVQGVFPVSSPEYVKMRGKVDMQFIYDTPTKHDTMYNLMVKLFREEPSLLDPYQHSALINSLTSRVAVIQGPPGTGKTYIGVKIVQTILSMEHGPELPILVLTYKNHALDEFVKEFLGHYPGEVIRVGGRSKDPVMDTCSFVSAQRSVRKTKELHDQLKDKNFQLDATKNMLKVSAELLDKKRFFSHVTFCRYLSEEQIKSLLLGCSLSRFKSDIEITVRYLEDFFAKNRCSLKTLIERPPKSGESQLNIRELFNFAIYQWIPRPEEFKKLESATEAARIQSQIEEALGMADDNADDEDDDVGLLDESDVRLQEEERLAATDVRELDVSDMLEFRNTAHKPNTRFTPYLLNCANRIASDPSNGALMNVEDLWNLTQQNRARFIQCILLKEYEEPRNSFETMLKEYQQQCMEKIALEDNHKVAVMKSKKVVGMTITGAAMNHELISQVKPGVVLVEEAAEVLEPHITAVLGPWVKHLILIGDHKQLKPSVETHVLCTKHNFNLSMMERLINNGISFKSLAMQNRMRPEFASLLHDIYPKLQNNLTRVSKNQAPTCMDQSMFFWDHTDPEYGSRSYSNNKEAERLVQLALYLIHEGYEPKQITILAAYQGQVSVLRKLMRKAEEKNPNLFGAPGDTQSRVIIHTIDNYQGDENDLVLVSLVRSGEGPKLKGFLNLLNRRCVAQSRARCGLYFAGNVTLFRTNSHWDKMISKMEESDCVGKKIVLQCSRHPSSKLEAETASDIKLDGFCREKCAKVMDCGRHLCPQLCQPQHSHDRCSALVKYTFPACGHSMNKECSRDPESLRCKEQCEELRDCKLHPCKKVCGLENHMHWFCNETVEFHFPSCGHTGTKRCSDDVTKQICSEVVSVALSKCHHLTTKACHEDESKVSCKEKCTQKISCGHLCSRKCGEPCETVMQCKECEKIRKVEAEKKRKEEEAMRAKAREETRKELARLKNEGLGDTTTLTEITPSGDSALEYYKVEDMVRRFVQPSHDWFPRVTKIEKVFNAKLNVEWLQARQDLFDPSVSELKFHGTNAEAIEGILKTGFRLPAKSGMFGKGIYFATDSSKSAQQIYTKGSNRLLLCDVLLGRTKTVDQPHNDMDLRRLHMTQHDSLYAKRGTKDTRGVLYDEFVVYNPSQALVKYVIHYSTQDTLALCSTRTPSSQSTMTHQQLLPKRHLDLDNDNDLHFRIAESQFLRLMNKTGKNYEITSVDLYNNPTLMRKFAAMKIQMEAMYPTGAEGKVVLAFHGTSPDNITNIVKENFKMEHSKITSKYGKGIYFSEFPDFSMGYTRGSSGALLLCQILPGKSYPCPGLMRGSGLYPGYDSHIAGKDQEDRGTEIVIFNPDQILPRYVVNFTNSARSALTMGL